MVAAQTAGKASRMALTRAQRKQLRRWRSTLGHAIWNLNESVLMHTLRMKYENRKSWTEWEIVEISKSIQKLYALALKVRHELNAFIERGGLRVGKRALAKQYKDRLEGAVEGMWLGAVYLRKLTPAFLDPVLELMAEAASPEFIGRGGESVEMEELIEEAGSLEAMSNESIMVPMLFFSFCPVAVEASREITEGRSRGVAPGATVVSAAMLDEQLEQLYARERVASELGLMGMVSETRDAIRSLKRQRSRLQKQQGPQPKEGASVIIVEKGGCYTSGMKALRASVMQLFYTLQAKDVRRIKMNAEDSANWYQWVSDIGEPPQTLRDQFQAIAKEDGKVVHVYDSKNHYVYSAAPPWLLGDDPDSLAERVALKQSKKIRQEWGYNWRDAIPGDGHEFRQSLDATQRRRVSEFLKRHPERSFSIFEIAALAKVPVHTPAEAERFQAMSAAQFRQNPDGDLSDIATDYGLHSALWRMDFG